MSSSNNYFSPMIPPSPSLNMSVDDADTLETSSIAPSDAASQQEPFRSPPLSTHSGSTTQGSRYSTSSLLGSGSACLATFQRENNGRAMFSILDWEWHMDEANRNAPNPVLQPHTDIHVFEDRFPTTPRQMARPLPLLPHALALERLGTQLRPLPNTIPSRLPSLLEESEGNQGEESDDEQSEVDSIFFVNEAQDNMVATSHSLVDLASTNAEATEDVAGIVAMLQTQLNREQNDEIEAISQTN